MPDFFRYHQRRLDAGTPHFGLLFLKNNTFPRHRHGVFVGQVVAALTRELNIVPMMTSPVGSVRLSAE